MATDKQIRDFALVKAGYKRIEQTKKPLNGNLLIDGIVHEHNKPFALLQHKRNRLIDSGIAPRRITTTYM